MFQALSKLFFKKHWSRHHSELGNLNDHEIEYYLRTSARAKTMKTLPHSFTHYREVTKFENDQLFLRSIMDRDESSEVIFVHIVSLSLPMPI